MALPDEDFDSLTDTAALNGTGGGTGWSGNWSGDASYVINTTYAQSGTKSVKLLTNSEVVIARSFTSAAASGIYTIYILRGSDGGRRNTQDLWIHNGTTATIMTGFYAATNAGATATPNVTMYDASATSIGSGLSLDAWHKIDIAFDFSTDQCQGRVDGGSWSSWTNFYLSGTGTDTGKISLATNNSGGGSFNTTTTLYWDSILEESTSAIKTINGLVKASAKTVNGLAIASVKTWESLA